MNLNCAVVLCFTYKITNIWTPFNVYIALSDAFLYSKTKKMKYDPPPKKRHSDTNGRDMATITCVCLYKQRVTWIFTRWTLSNSAITTN